jgi:hypothetical protein
MHVVHPIRSAGQATVDDLAFALCLSIVAVALAALAGFADPGPSAEASPAIAMATPGRQQPAGAFTGTYVHGAPVYRLPAITVRASRDAEMARIEQGDKPAGNTSVDHRPAHQG